MSTIKVSITGSNAVRDNHWEIPSGSLTPVRTLLIEAGPRNNRSTTESINLANWTLFQVTRTASFTSAPDGTNTATFIKENTANNFHYFQIASSDTFTGKSIYLKPAGRTRFLVGLNDGAGQYAMADINLTGTGSVNGNVVGGIAANAVRSTRIVPYTGSWYRVDVVARGGAIFQIQLHNGSSTSYTGDGVSGVYVWGYNDNDWNRGSEPAGMNSTMFIRGEGSQTGSRARDVISWPIPTPQPMTVYVRGIVQTSTGVYTERKLVQLGQYSTLQDNAAITTNNTSLDQTAITQFISSYKLVTSSVTPSTGIRPGDPIELCMRLYRTGSGVGTQISYALNGGSVQVGGSSSISSGDFSGSWNQINSMSLCTSETSIQYAQSFAFRNILIATGSKTLEQMRTLAGI